MGSPQLIGACEECSEAAIKGEASIIFLKERGTWSIHSLVEYDVLKLSSVPIMKEETMKRKKSKKEEKKKERKGKKGNKVKENWTDLLAS